MFYRTVDFDVSGVNPHAPSYVDMAPGNAMVAREKFKISKYGTHSQQGGRTFAPFVLDSYGCLAPAALQLLKDIRDESLSLPSALLIPSASPDPPFWQNFLATGNTTTPGLWSSG